MAPTPLRQLREELYAAVAQGDLAGAVRLAEMLEARDVAQRAEWARRLGDLHRRLGDAEKAAKAYERAALAYEQAGFERRAAAMQQVRHSTWPPPAS